MQLVEDVLLRQKIFQLGLQNLVWTLLIMKVLLLKVLLEHGVISSHFSSPQRCRRMLKPMTV